jgi:hypothetical protein
MLIHTSNHKFQTIKILDHHPKDTLGIKDVDRIEVLQQDDCSSEGPDKVCNWGTALNLLTSIQSYKTPV